LFARQLIQYQRLNSDPSFRATLPQIYPILHESEQGAGIPSWEYFHQDLWAAKRIYTRRPEKHVDIGSRIDGFVAHLLVFMPVCVVDIRPLNDHVPGLNVVTDDATELRMFATNSIDSLSCLHAAEHFGLGRYSDPIDPEAWIKFVKALQRVLAPNGRLYFSVPVGRQRIEFNAHRVFQAQTVLRAFDALELVSFSFVGDGGMHEGLSRDQLQGIGNGCGLFEFTKNPDLS
jgi:SAM-dependent methyltransferase